MNIFVDITELIINKSAFKEKNRSILIWNSGIMITIRKKSFILNSNLDKTINYLNNKILDKWKQRQQN